MGTKWIEDKAAWDETVEVCSICGVEKHEHNWVTKTIHHDAEGHNEPIYATENVCVCSQCGRVFRTTDEFLAHTYPFIENGCKDGCSVSEREVQVGTKWVEDKAAWDETVEVCSICGETK